MQSHIRLRCERIFCLVQISKELSQKIPGARVVITGSGEDSTPLKDWFAEIGLERDRLAFETDSSNTFENALFSYRQLEPGPG